MISSAERNAGITGTPAPKRIVYWIPTADDLPTRPGSYLAAVRSRVTGQLITLMLGYIPRDDVWIDDDGNEIPDEVVFWARLPKPPAVKEN